MSFPPLDFPEPSTPYTHKKAGAGRLGVRPRREGKRLAARYFPALLNAVSSPQGPLTAVFGMGTGVASPREPPTRRMGRHAWPGEPAGEWRERKALRRESPAPLPAGGRGGGQASRPIRSGPLKASRPLHVRPVDPVVCRGPSGPCGPGRLVSGGAWRLDAFSAYPFATWLPGNARRPDNRNTRGRPPPVLSY